MLTLFAGSIVLAIRVAWSSLWANRLTSKIFPNTLVAIRSHAFTPLQRYVRFCINRVRLLRSYNVEPILVFDGCSLPAKGKTDEQRRKLRKEHLRLGMEALQTGNGSLAKDHFDKSTEITTTMTRKVQDVSAKQMFLIHNFSLFIRCFRCFCVFVLHL